MFFIGGLVELAPIQHSQAVAK